MCTKDEEENKQQKISTRIFQAECRFLLPTTWYMHHTTCNFIEKKIPTIGFSDEF